MFGRSNSGGFKPVPFQSQARTGSMPRWAQLMLVGVALGALGLYLIQENFLPKRLTATKSVELEKRLEVADKDRDGLRAESKELKAKLAQAEAVSKKAQVDLQSAQSTTDKLQKNLSQFVGALPPDPRGGAVGIRAGSFSAQGSSLSYNVILTRSAKPNDTLRGSLQLVVMGQKPGGRNETVTLPSVPLEIDTYQQLTGALNLPDGMVPREITVKILRGAGELVSLRVYRI
jgi:hypothetical protein